MKKKLLILVPSLKLGGQERVATNTANIMSDDYEVFLAVFDNSDAVYSPNCPVININLPAVSSKIGKIINVFKRTLKVIKLKKQLNVNYTISFGTTADIINAFSNFYGRALLNIRGFSSINDSIFQKFIYKKSDAIICCSKKISNELKKYIPNKKDEIYTLYNPYNLKDLQELSKETVKDFNFNCQTIVMHGRLDKVKNYPRLIKAFSIVRKQLPSSKLLIIGEGDMRDKLQMLINHYNLQEDVSMIGFRKNPFAYITRASLYVLSSYSEGFPNALIEGMTFLPAVAVDCKSGPREIMYDSYTGRDATEIEEAEYGILVPAATNKDFDYQIGYDDEILAEAILMLLNDSKKYELYKENARNRVEEFSFKVYKENLINILEH